MRSLFQQIGLEGNRFSYGRSMPSILLHRKKLQTSKTPLFETVGDFGRLAGELTKAKVWYRRASFSLSLPSCVFAYLLAERFGFLRIFLTFDFQIELCRAIGVEWIFAFQRRRLVAPMFIDPKPVFRMFANDRLKLVPACLRNLLVRTAGGEPQPRQNTDH